MRNSAPILLAVALCLSSAIASSAEPAKLDGAARRAGIPISIDLSAGFKGADQAVRLWHDGKRQEALKLLQHTRARGVPEQRRRLMVGALLLELHRPGPAAEALSTVDATLPEIRDHVIALRSQALLQAKRPDDALEVLDTLPSDSPLSARATRLIARSEIERNRPGSAIVALDRLVEGRPIESLEASTLLIKADALSRLGTAEGDQESMRYYRTIRLYHPLSGEARDAAAGLKALAARGVTPPEDTPAEKFLVANAYLGAYLNEEAVRRLEPLFAAVAPTDPLRCDIAYALGKAHQNLRHYEASGPALTAAAEVCDRDRQVKAIYMMGRGAVRRKQLDIAEPLLRDLANRFPDHSYADDAIFLLGVSFQDDGNQEKAIALLEEQIRTWPMGDMRSEATWRLAWGAYRQGKLGLAISSVEGLLSDARSMALRAGTAAALPEGAMPDAPGSAAAVNAAPGAKTEGPSAAAIAATAVEDGTIGTAVTTAPAGAAPEQDAEPSAAPSITREAYWRARWLELQDPKRKDSVAEAYEALIRFAPADFYSVLAFQRLKQLSPARAKTLVKEAAKVGKPERTKIALDAQPAEIRRAVELIRAGLWARAVGELVPLIGSSRASGELLVSYLLEHADRYDLSHAIPRGYLARTGQTRIDARTRPAYLVAWPPAFEAEVRKAAEKEQVDPLLILSLAREESAFDPDIRSWAGATGLVQLMEPTAQIMARELKKKGKVSASDLTDPALNLELAAHYIRNILDAFSGHAGLTVPSYNAGEGAVARWLQERGTLPFDEFVEEIPYKQTRDYTRRVLGSYQAYHYLYRPEMPFIRIDLKIPTERKARGKNEVVP